MNPRFGFITFQARGFPEMVEAAQALESAGIDNAWLIDHLRPEFAPDAPLLEAWTALAALAARTSTIRIGTAVTNVALRNPAILCRQAITVDQISGGRLDMAIGAGFYESEQRMLGIDYPDAQGRAARLREAAEVLAEGLAGRPVTSAGRFWQLDDVPMAPGPVQQPRIPLWIAASGAASVRTAAEHADVLLTMGDEGDPPDATLAKLRRRFQRLEEFCDQIGRDVSSMRRAYLVGWSAERPYESQEEFVDFAGSFAETGVTDFIFSLGQAGGLPSLERLAGWIESAREAPGARAGRMAGL